MSPSLLSLQPEVHLAIVDALGPDYTGLRNEDIEGMYGENGGRARSRRSRLQDRQTQSRRNLFSWSCISKYFRALLAPRIFNALILRNEEKSGDSVEAIATHPEYGNHVREIQFIGYAPGDAKRDDPAFKDTKHVLPHNVASILSDLKRFPKLQTLGTYFRALYSVLGPHESIDTCYRSTLLGNESYKLRLPEYENTDSGLIQ